MPNLVNQLVEREYQDVLGQAEGMVIVAMPGLTVSEVEGLRTSLAEGGATLHMVRNRIVRRVMDERGLSLPAEVLVGNVGFAVGSTESTIHAAKVFSTPEVKKAGKIELRASVLEGAVLAQQDTVALADVPDKDTLRARLVGCIQGPMRGLAVTLAGLPGGLARVMQARVDAGGGAAE
jgi:large subunit ribosomal protein L10